MADIIETIRQLCKKKGVSVHKMEMDLGFANGYVRKLNGKVPSDRLEAMANYFGVPMDELLGQPSSQDYIYTITGDSMAPELPNGTQLVIHIQDYADNGDVVIVRQNGSESVRRLMAYHDAVMLLAFNPAYPPELLDGEIVGKVIESRRKW